MEVLMIRNVKLLLEKCDVRMFFRKFFDRIKALTEKFPGILVELRPSNSLPKLVGLIKHIFAPERRFATVALLITLFLLISISTIHTKGSILPVDRDVVRAFEILKSTNTGRVLIERVRDVTNGSFIYLTIGNTDGDRLFDECGKKVRGLTRVDFRTTGRFCKIDRVTVITNRDLVGTDIHEIVKSLAFELENVYQAFNLSCVCPGTDSPLAPLTQARVIEELGINN
jgi:hypothetical protein